MLRSGTAEIHYKNNFITGAILRVDFSHPLDNLTHENVDLIKSKLTDCKFEFREKKVANVNINLTNQSSELKVSGLQAIFEFTDKKGRFILQNDYFCLELNDYSNFLSFKTLFNHGLSVCAYVLGISEFKRIGLRYINVIKSEQVKKINDWVTFIKPPFVPLYNELLPSHEDTIDNYNEFTIRKSMNNLALSDGEDMINLNFGLWNDKFPSKIIDHQFIIDIDCFISDMIIGTNDFQERLPKMNILCVDLFRQIIMPKLETKLIGN